MENLAREDYEIIKQLLDLSKDVKDIYEKLIEFELTDEKNSFEYERLIESLEIKREEESKLFQKIGNDTRKIQRILEYLCEKSKINNFFEDLRILTSGNIDEIIKRRIVLKLLSKKLNIDKTKLDEMGLQLDEDLELVGIKAKPSKNNAYYGLSNLLLLSSILKEDFLKTLFVILKKEKEFSETIITLAFLYDFIEQIFLYNYSEDKVYWSSKLASELKGISEESYKNAKEIYGYKLANSICHLEHNEILNRMLRVSLLFCTAEDIEILKKEYPEFLSSIIDSLKNDKEIPLVVSLKPRRQA